MKAYIVTGSSSYDENEIERVFENLSHAQAYIEHLEKRNDAAEKNGGRPWEPTYSFRPSYEISEWNVTL